MNTAGPWRATGAKPIPQSAAERLPTAERSDGRGRIGAGSARGSTAGERRLLASARSGGAEGRKAFGELVGAHQSRLVRLVGHLLGREGGAEDVAQEAFLRAYLALDRYPLGVPFWPWIRVIATRLAHNARRDARTRSRYEDRAESRQLRPASGLAEREVIEQVLGQLSYPHREILVLRHAEGLSLKELAAELDLGLSAAKMRLSRAHKECRAVHERLLGTCLQFGPVARVSTGAA